VAPAAPYFVAGDLAFRPIAEDDVGRLVRWLADPEVGGWWLGVTFDHDEAYVNRDFVERAGERYVTKAIVELDGRPIGFQQWYPLAGEPGTFAEYDIAPEVDAWGIDQFIGESDLHGRGIGSRQVRAVVDWLVTDRGVDLVVTDPVVENARAIRCYEKAGFGRVRVLPDHEVLDGERRDSWLMEYRESG
jgi:aminoglycoside 6'-N-acetyltransferase